MNNWSSCSYFPPSPSARAHYSAYIFQVLPPKSGSYLLIVLLIMGILVPETCWGNKTAYFVASSWFFTFTITVFVHRILVGVNWSNYWNTCRETGWKSVIGLIWLTVGTNFCFRKMRWDPLLAEELLTTEVLHRCLRSFPVQRSPWASLPSCAVLSVSVSCDSVQVCCACGLHPSCRCYTRGTGLRRR
jgi:hypothetical protein